MAEAALQIAVNNRVKIESDLPIPQGLGRRGGKYPWDQMKVGDSFEFPEGTKKTNASNCAASAGKARGWRFTTRLTENNRLRVWRIA